MKKWITLIYSITHFFVDLACIILISNLVKKEIGEGIVLFQAILIYDIIAFALQFPIGIIADRINKNAIIAAVGCLLVALRLCFL